MEENSGRLARAGQCAELVRHEQILRKLVRQSASLALDFLTPSISPKVSEPGETFIDYRLAESGAQDIGHGGTAEIVSQPPADSLDAG